MILLAELEKKFLSFFFASYSVSFSTLNLVKLFNPDRILISKKSLWLSLKYNFKKYDNILYVNHHVNTHEWDDQL